MILDERNKTTTPAKKENFPVAWLTIVTDKN
jgi:hypothetical protein